ncbi:MAG TPA: nickel transporter, partial [Methylotenera sp.]|nr:nickel transporter [Methylotenera sp.]
MLQVIPVIDLKQGPLKECHVVHAKHGQRASYKPIKSILSDSSGVLNVVEGLLKLYPFRIIYIADIDAISNTGNHFEQIE